MHIPKKKRERKATLESWPHRNGYFLRRRESVLAALSKTLGNWRTSALDNYIVHLRCEVLGEKEGFSIGPRACPVYVGHH